MNGKILTMALLAATSLAFAADYFPLEKGNSWTFSFVSTTMVVIPNPPTTRDSGTVKWEVALKYGRDDPLMTLMVRTRSLVRHAITGGVVGNFDTTYSPPLVTVDTLTIEEHAPWNGLFFSGDTCSFAVHDPAGPMPAHLSLKDTSVPYGRAIIDGKKTIPSSCSCYKNILWYFVLADILGPVEAYLTWCPGMAGTSYHETWKLVSREYPAAVKNGPVSLLKDRGIDISQTFGQMVFSLQSRSHGKEAVSAAIFTISGREIARIAAAADKIIWNPESAPAGTYVIQVKSGNRIRTRQFCLDRR
jgi:hypothetical protein